MGDYHSYNSRVEIATFVGLRFSKVEGVVGGEEVNFYTDEVKKFTMAHSQDCCESVYIESIDGDLQDLVDSPILFAYNDTNEKEPPSPIGYEPDSHTWTFYRIGTIKGSAVIRWYGSSNGYYSESVDIYETTKEN